MQPDHDNQQDLSQDRPDGLELSWQCQSNKQCTSVNHHSINKEILLGSSKGVHKLNKATAKLSDVSTIYPHAQVIEHKGVVYIGSICTCEQKFMVFKYSLKTKSSKILFSFPANYVDDAPYRFGVFDQYIVCWDVYNKTIQLFDVESKRLLTHELPLCQKLFNLQINSDSLLYSTVRYDDQHYLNMYSLQVKEDHEPLLVWSCTLGQACTLALTEENLAVLVGKRNRTLYIVGPTGKS